MRNGDHFSILNEDQARLIWSKIKYDLIFQKSPNSKD